MIIKLFSRNIRIAVTKVEEVDVLENVTSGLRMFQIM